MSTEPAPARRALVAGATGLIGRALLPRLLADARWREVHAVVRRPAPALAAMPRLHLHHSTLTPPIDGLPAVDDLFCCLGTTINSARSQAVFRTVDLDTVIAIARGARAAGATRLAVVSALGADAHSKVFYNRVKGEMEAAVAQLGFDAVVIARPSLLAGDRAALGQALRLGERLALALALPLAPLLPAGWRPIQADCVASALIEALAQARAGVRIVESAELAQLGHGTGRPA